MKKIFSFLLYAFTAIISLTSCITSLQPLVTHETITTDDRVAGNWNHEGTVVSIEPLPKSKLVKTVQESGMETAKVFEFTGDPAKDSVVFAKAYAVSYKQNGVTYNMVAAMMKAGGHLFMDIYPAVMHDKKVKEDQSAPFDFNNEYLAGFTVAKVSFTGNAITLNFIDGQYVKEQVKSGRMKLKHESDELFGTFLITASSGELQRFLQKYASDERIFNKESSVTLTRQPIDS